MLAMMEASDRSQEALPSEASLLYQISTRLIDATTPEEVLAVLGEVGPPRRLSSALFTIELDQDGRPHWLRLAASISTGVTLPIPARLDCKAIPMSAHWIEHPRQAVLVGDLTTDARVDRVTRELCATNGLRAFVLLPLYRHGRWLGVVTISYLEPQVFSALDEQLFTAVLRYGGAVMEHRLLLQETQQALEENRRQRLAMQALIEALPTGIFVADARTGTPLLSNRAAVGLLGRSVDPKAGKDAYTDTYHLYHPDTERPVASEELPLVIAMSGGTARRDIDIVKSDGSRITVDVIAAPIRDEHGVITSAVASFQDVSERRQSEVSRLRLQEELIATQAAALAERSTPLIPISDSIMVMPVIGSIDSERAQQMLNTLLEGVSRSRVRFAILDITGVKNIDTLAANSIISAAKSVRLLGVEPVLTGIRAEVAQTLVGLGVDLREVATRSTLQSGIKYANQMVRGGPR